MASFLPRRSRRLAHEREPATLMRSIVLINPFDKLPGEDFRDQRYTFLYHTLKRRGCHITWITSDFHHWSHQRRSHEAVPEQDRNHVRLVPTLPYIGNLSLRRLVSHSLLSFRMWRELTLLRPKPDVVLCAGCVEVMYLAALWGRRHGIRVIVDVLDLWPDLFVLALPAPMRRLGRLLFAPWFYLSQRTYVYASHVTSVSKAYTAWAMRRGKREDWENSSHYYLGCGKDTPLDPPSKSREKLRCLFAGQFGFSYDLETVIEVARRLWSQGRTDIEFVLAGDGYKKQDLVLAARGVGTVTFPGWLQPPALADIATHCHVALNCYTSIATQSVPSKMFDYMQFGLYILNSLPGEAQELLERYQIGGSYRAEDSGQLYAQLVQLAGDIEPVITKGLHAREVFDSEFDAAVVYERMVDDLLLQDIAIGKGTHESQRSCGCGSIPSS
jgi:glycosyltransferase involved in cell wall biosynthesis